MQRFHEIIFTQKEQDEYDAFINKHDKCKCKDPIGGKISFIFTDTGIGTITVLRCNVCKKENNITDFDEW